MSYDPGVGRFLNEDPLGFDGGDPNFYAFVSNSPLNFTDPSGLTQAGNPLDALAGGFTARPTSSTFSTFEPSLQNGLVNVFSPTRRPARAPSVSLSALGNVASTAIASQFPITRSIVGAGLGAAAATLTAAPPLIREITPGDPIVPRNPAEVPGIAPALANPSRYVISNHSDQGSFVLDTAEGNVRFVTGDEYLPIRELQRRSGIERDNAIRAAGSARLLQEALITISPLHETARDAAIVFAGHDLFEPNRPISFEEQRAAIIFLAAPAGNSGNVRLADDALDLLRGSSRVPMARTASGKNFIPINHVQAQAAEFNLIQQVRRNPNEVPLFTHQYITENGADLGSYNTRTGLVSLFDSKSSIGGRPRVDGTRPPVRVVDSETFSTLRRREKALDTLRTSVRNSHLPIAEQRRALEAIDNGQVRFVTAGSGNVQKSVISRFRSPQAQ